MLTYTTPSLPLTWLLSNSAFQKTGNTYYEIGNNPKLFSASENVINYIFNNNINAGSHSASRLVLNVFGSVSLNGSITLTNDFMTVVIRPSDTPNSNEFYRAGGSTTPANRSLIAESIAFELRNNLTFNQYYNVWSQGATVFIEARVIGSSYNFNITTLNASLLLLGGVSQTNVVSTDIYEWQSLIDYNAFVEVYVANGVYGQNIDKRNSYLTDIYSVPPTSKEAWAINISDSIKNYVDIVLPTKRNVNTIGLKQLDFQVNTNGEAILPVVRPYYIVYGAEYRFAAGLEKKKFISGVSDVRFVLNGAFGLLEDYNFNPYILDTTSTTSVKFMTSSPSVKDTDYTSQEFLHFYRRSNTFELGNFGVEVEFKFYDGTSIAQSYPLGNYAGIIGTISIDISPNCLDINNIETVNGKMVDTYTAKLYWTINSTQRYYSEARTYTMKRICNKNSNNVIFVNEFGVFETLNFTGEIIKNVNRDVSYSKRAIGINTPNTGFDTISDEVSMPVLMNNADSYILSTELIDKEYYNWLSTILNSSSVYIYDEEGSRYRCIIITDYEYSYNSLNETSTFSMTFSYTVNNNYITR